MALLATGLLAASSAAGPARAPAGPALPERVRLVVLHTPGGPDYSRPERRWTFLSPRETFALWGRPGFGAHWTVWTDGSIWPRRPLEGEPESFRPATGRLAEGSVAARLVAHAAPVLSHVAEANTRSLGVEVSHSGRIEDPFPEAQIRSLCWLLRSIFALSGGRLDATSVVGHKDLDRRPAWVTERCPSGDCAVYVDGAGRPYRRRVDPPEGLFAALADQGLVVPRGWAEGDVELRRAEAIPPGRIPDTAPHPAEP